MGSAVLALVAALASAVAPAHEQRTAVAWPTASPLESESTRPIGGAVLLVARQSAAELTVTLPCESAPPEAGFLFATEQHPQVFGGLQITTDGDALVVMVGPTIIASVPGWVAESPCDGALRFVESSWTLTRDGTVLASGVASSAPAISGLFAPTSMLGGDHPRVGATVLTEVQGSRPSALQWFFLAVTFLCLVVVATLFAWREPRQPQPTWRRSFGLIDVAVGGLLTIWAVVGPALLDDGWIMQSAEHRYPGGQFRGFYQPFDSWVPLGFVHYTFHWLISLVSSEIVFYRLAVLALLLAGWLATRVTLGRVVPRTSRLAWASGAAAYLVFGMAWLVTLRAEPMIAALSAVTLTAALNFVRSRNIGWILVGGFASVIAASIHPAGPVAATPMLLVAPTVFGELRLDRRRVWPVLAALAASAALLVVLVFADSDLRLWFANKDAFGRDGVHASGWRDELGRYDLLLSGSYDTVVRRASVFLALVVVALFLVRFDRRRNLASILPSAALTVSFALLAASPSKWPWHFGTIGLIAAAGLTMEVHELGLRSKKFSISHAVLVVGFLMVGSVAWRSSEGWGSFNLVGGVKGFARLGHHLSNPAVVLVVVGVGALGLTLRTRDRTGSLFRVIRAVPLIVLAPMIVATVARFATQAAGGPYSLARQNLRALTGRGDCGAAPLLKLNFPQDSVLADTSTGLRATTQDFVSAGLRPLQATSGAFFDDGSRPGWVSDVIGTFVTGDDDTGWAAGSWQEIPTGSFGLFAGLSGRVGSGNEFILQRGVRSGSDVTVTDSFNLTVNHDSAGWSRVVLGRWDSAPDTVARVVIVDRSTGLNGWLAVSPITVARTESLQDLSDRGVQVMVSPFVRTFMPCLREPGQPGGIAAQPDLVIDELPVSPTSPSHLIQDVYGRTRVPVTLDGNQVMNADSYEPGYTWATVGWSRVGG